jgi:hypothetical protein
MKSDNHDDISLNINTLITCLFFRKNRDNQIEMLTIRSPEDGGAAWSVPQGKVGMADFLDCEPSRVEDRMILKTFVKNHFKNAVNVDFDQADLEIIRLGDYTLVCSVSEVNTNPMIGDQMSMVCDVDLSEINGAGSSSHHGLESQWADIWDFMGNNTELLHNNLMDAIIKLLQKMD